MSVPNAQKITATGQTVVGAADERRGGKLVLQVSGTFSVSMVPKVYIRGGTLVASTAQNIGYTVQKTGVFTDGATTAITAAGSYTVALEAGQLLVLDATFTSGTAIIESMASPVA